MSLLLRFERRIEAFVEGLFTRWARDRVHPVEIGRRALQEMEAGAVAGLQGTVVPNEYQLFLNPRDFAPYESFAPALVSELADTLRARAAELGARMPGPVRVSLEARDAIARGEIYVAARLTPGAPGGDARASRGPTSGPQPCNQSGLVPGGGDAADDTAAVATDTRVYRHEPGAGPRLCVLAGPSGTAGREFALDRPALIIGRRADHDIVLDDPSVSRSHARIQVSGDEVVIEDLGSTNGTALNGRPIGRGRAAVRDGDRIQIGTALLEYRSGR